MSADLTLKTNQDNNDIQSVELFILNHGFVLHRHCLTENEKKAKAFGIFRKFWNKYYTKQEIVLTNKEVFSILKCISENKTLQDKIKRCRK
jgi:hypothetical protein